MDYDVVWNGAHHDKDEDLFFAERTEKHVMVAKSQVSTLATVVGVLRASWGVPLTMRQIASSASLGIHKANSGVHQLKKQGRLGSRLITITDRPVRYGHQQVQEYWLL